MVFLNHYRIVMARPFTPTLSGSAESLENAMATMNRSPVLVVGTADTKGRELAYLAEALRTCGCPARTVDVGTQGPAEPAMDISRTQVLSATKDTATPLEGDRASRIDRMGRALARYLAGEHAAGRLAGVIGLGGSGGTALLAAGFAALPVGVPKMIVSTMASGRVDGYVGATDLILVPSLVDVAGLNRVLRPILRRAAAAMAGMVLAPTAGDETNGKPVVGMTMFGVTTPSVTGMRGIVEAAGWEPMVFHATGTGGKIMERLVASGSIAGVIDATTTEVADEIVGGVMPGGADRMEAIIRAGVPYVVSVGALDMVNFGAMETVPEKFRGRKFHRHNAQVTLMRTTPEENRVFGRFIAGKLNASAHSWAVVLPAGGVSALDAPGQPFHDPEATGALLETLRAELRPGPGRTIADYPGHINDPQCSEIMAGAFLRLAGRKA